MESLDQINEKCSQFIRTNLPGIREVGVNMPTIPYFHAVPTISFIRDGYPRDPGGGRIISLPWRARLPNWTQQPGEKAVKEYARIRARFVSGYNKLGWDNIAISMRRFAVAWENPFRADILADIVSALEQLVVNSNREVSYKLRTRVAYFLGKSPAERKNLRSGRSHGNYLLPLSAHTCRCFGFD